MFLKWKGVQSGWSVDHGEEEAVARSASGGSRTLRVVVGFALLMAVVSHRGDGRCSVKIMWLLSREFIGRHEVITVHGPRRKQLRPRIPCFGFISWELVPVPHTASACI